MKRALFIVIAALLTSFAIFLIAICISYPPSEMKYYETQDIADYGVITGNCLNEKAATRINSLFPAVIEDRFQDVRYVYHAQNMDAIGCEAYLEFTLSNDEEFDEYVNSVIGGKQTSTFPYDPGFKEYVIYDSIAVNPKYDADESGKNYSIIDARIEKMLFNETERRVIYVVMLVLDGGATDTKDLWTYFSRFNIDPLQYSKYTKELIEQNPSWLENRGYY